MTREKKIARDKSTKNDEPIFKFSDAKFIKQFPGILRCAVQCINGINSNKDLTGSNQVKGTFGMCYLYSGKDGHFIIFCSNAKIIVTTHQGIYTNFQTFHSVRCDSSLFVFEEDFSRYEEALCAIWDTEYYVNKLKEYVALSRMMSIFDSSFYRNEKSEDDQI